MGKGRAGFGPGRTSPELGRYWGEVGTPRSSPGWGWVLTLHLGWQGPGRATPQTVPPLQDSPAPPPAARRGAALPLTPGRRWGAHSAPDGWAASCVGSRGAPRARGLCPAPSSPPAQALPSALTRELLCLPAGVGGSALLYPTASEGLHSRPPHGTGTAGAAEGVPVKGCPVSPPYPCSHLSTLLGCPPLAALHPLVPGTDPKRNLTSNGANPGPLPRLLPLCTWGAGGCGVRGAGLAPLGLFIAGAPPSTHPCTPQQHLGQGRGSPSSSNRGQHQ